MDLLQDDLPSIVLRVVKCENNNFALPITCTIYHSSTVVWDGFRDEW